MKRILFPTYYGPNDIANFNCAHGPFSMMRDQVEIIVPYNEFAHPNEMIKSNWWTNFRWWMGVDACFLHRPYGWYGQQIISAAKSHHVPLWVHHDDDLLAIPETNPYYNAYVRHDKEYPSVEESYKQADIISCQSVLMLKMLKEKYNRQDAMYIPICLDDRLLKLKKPWTDNKKICWRGSDSHKHDILTFKEPLQEVFNKYSDYEFHFTILNPRELGFRVKNLVVHEPLPMIEFYNRITQINASHHIVLLEDTPFNRVKSHLAWLDSTLAGSSVYAPRFEEFDRNGICSYKSFDLDFHWYMGQNHEANHTDSWSLINRGYLNSHANITRRLIINTL